MKEYCPIIACISIFIYSPICCLSSDQKGGLIAGAIGLVGTAATKNPKIIIPVTLASAAIGGVIGKSKERKGRKRRRNYCKKIQQTTQISDNIINS